MLLPPALRGYTGGEEAVEVTAATLKEAVTQLDALFPGLGERILDDTGGVRRHVHVFVNGESAGREEPAQIILRDGDVVHILPSVAGGLHD